MLVREHFRPTGNPVADPANVVMGDGYRITLLTDGLVRLEWSASGRHSIRAAHSRREGAEPVTPARPLPRWTREAGASKAAAPRS